MKRYGVYVAILVAGVLVAGAYAQDKAMSSMMGMPMHKGKGMMMGARMEGDTKIVAERRQMIADMDAATAKLDELMARMNSATGAQKVDAMAGVISELVAQQKGMHRRMMSMEPEMMRHMMTHMESGKMAGMQKSMSMCPMMNGAATSKEGGTKEDESHTQHHSGSPE